MTVLTITARKRPQAQIDYSQDGRIIVTVKGVEIDIQYDNDGIMVDMMDGDELKEISADF